MSDKALRAKVMLAELEALGLTVDDLIAASGGVRTPLTVGPTVAEYVPVVAASYQHRSRRTYNSYGSLLVEMCGPTALTAVTVEDLLRVAEEASRRVAPRPGERGATVERAASRAWQRCGPSSPVRTRPAS